MKIDHPNNIILGASHKMPVIALFLAKKNIYPSSISLLKYYDRLTIISLDKMLIKANKDKADDEKIYRIEHAGDYGHISYLFPLWDEAWIYVIREGDDYGDEDENDIWIDRSFSISVIGDSKICQKYANTLRLNLAKNACKKKKKRVECHLISYDNGSFDLDAFTFNTPKIDFELNYPSFKDHYPLFIEQLKTSEKGLYILHGKKGTGKTHLIRKMINDLAQSDKKIIYVPPSMVESLTDPSFVPFMLENKNSIFLIEDAEKILLTREDFESTSGGVSNILNITDGLLSDALKCQIICTFNTDLKNIDTALLRKGRLTFKHEFENLDKDQAQKLSDSLGFKTKITTPMVLADIYNQDSEPDTSPVKNGTEIGFRQTQKN